MATLDFASLGSISLAFGDKDAAQTWGGGVLSGTTGTPVQQMQAALVSVGLLDAADGVFGSDTRAALARFQWSAANCASRLKVSAGTSIADGSIESITAIDPGASGVCTADLAGHLIDWQSGPFLATTPLVRLNLAGFSNIRVAPTFTVLAYPAAQHGEILIHADFAAAIAILNTQAAAHGVTLLINQTFRSAEIPPSGAIVPPAQKSQHLIGHAVDLNIKDGDVLNTSSSFASGTATSAARAFISAAKSSGLRWGGDFTPADPVHFDDFVHPDSDAYAMDYFFAQHCFRQGHPMRQVS
jgi:peptidoglycan hydrolase-like protein with peptidoglycan-binding domain